MTDIWLVTANDRRMLVTRIWSAWHDALRIYQVPRYKLSNQLLCWTQIFSTLSVYIQLDTFVNICKYIHVWFSVSLHANSASVYHRQWSSQEYNLIRPQNLLSPNVFRRKLSGNTFDTNSLVAIQSNRYIFNFANLNAGIHNIFLIKWARLHVLFMCFQFYINLDIHI